MKKTFLFSEHEKLKARLVDFHGWLLPMQYPTGALEEHELVRSSAGLFDISHMGRVLLEGQETADFLESICTNRISDMQLNQIRYTVLVDVNGMSIDDILVYRHQVNQFACVLNGANREKDLEFLQRQAKNFDVLIYPYFDHQGILALQGPASLDVLGAIFPELQKLKPMRGLSCQLEGKEIYISRTGYTGELGFEIYGHEDVLKELWQKCLSSNAAVVKPIGLAARDSLRLEMGYILYGNDLSSEIFANESLARWTIKWDKDFIGKRALEKIEESPKKRFAYGVILQKPGVARAQMPVLINGEKRGVVTSGGYSPMLKQSIALVLIDKKLQENDQISIEIRRKQVEARRIQLPFYKK